MKAKHLNSLHLFSGCLYLLICLSLISCETKTDEELVKSVYSFQLDEVKLLEGPFHHATSLNHRTLLGYEPDRFLARFRMEAGLEPKEEPYQGWEAESLAGHSLGHYLSACSQMLLTTGDEVYADRIEYIVSELKACQDADGDGYIGAFSNGKKIFQEELAEGDIRPQSFNLNGIWAPFYTHHKVLAGLRDAHRLAGNETALSVARSFANWIYGIVSVLDTQQIQKVLECEHGGMNEVLVDLYNDTNDSKYLDMSHLFHHKVVIDSLAHGVDILPGIHGNTQIPKLIGVARRHQVTKSNNDLNAATFFWDRVVNHHSYVTGGHGNHEYFGNPDQLRNRLSSSTTETCNVYNMLKLSSLLFEIRPTAEVADYYERALFNHILSSQHPDDGKVIYNLSLEMGGHKQYQDPEWFTCCVGTGMENHGTHGKAIYYHNDDELYVSQFISSELQWLDKGLKLIQTTKFPDDDLITLEFEMDDPVEFELKFRRPYWAEKGVIVKVNGEPYTAEASMQSFVGIKRKWNSGDKLEIEMPFSLRLESMPDDSNRVAILYGPLVLAGILGQVDDPDAFNDDYVPVLITEERNPSQWLTNEAEPNSFKTDGVGFPRDIHLRPFYKTHDTRYSVYWDIFDREQWNENLRILKEEKEAKKILKASSIDFIDAGVDESEASHSLAVDKAQIVRLKNRRARQANRGGSFSYNLGVLPDQEMTLAVEYWGGYTGSKTFNILVDNKKIATENISSKKDGHFILEKYPIPFQLTKGKERVIVSFVPHEGHRAGPVFEIFSLAR